jgi:hypothetical protein
MAGVEWPVCGKCNRGILVHWFSSDGLAFCEAGRVTEASFSAEERGKVYGSLGRPFPARLKDALQRQDRLM